MVRLTIICLSILVCCSLFAQETETYSVIKVELDNQADIQILGDLGVAVDHVHWEEDGSLELFVSSWEKTIITNSGFQFETIIADTKVYADKIANQNKDKNHKSNECGLEQFTLGSIAGYHDYSEIVAILETIADDNPNITNLFSIGKSHEERDIWVLKVSDNAERDESAKEATAYYDALTHAREPLSMMSTLYYIQWLTENYNNPKTVAKYLVDNREMHFILVVNPDGYTYNTENFPNGGGGWRKNRRVIDDECTGVDLNRNFNAQYDGPGSSSNAPCSDIYRGPSATSEPETKLIQDYIGTILPATAFSSHSYSQVIIDPDKKVDHPSYDFATYANYASEFTHRAYHGYGSADDLIGYLASGTTLDYLFESGAIAWTPEIGTQFWEPQGEICRYVSEMLEPMKFVSKIAGLAPSYHNHTIADGSKIINDQIVDLNVVIKNKGLRPLEGNFKVTLAPIDNTTKVITPTIEYEIPFDYDDSSDKILTYQLELNDIDQSTSLKFDLDIYHNGLFVENTVIEVQPGNYNILFEDDFENGMDNWIHSNNGGQWSLTTIDQRSGSFSLIDSEGAHPRGVNASISLADPIDLSNTVNPYLFLDLKHSLNPYSGFLDIAISGDGTDWEKVTLLDKSNIDQEGSLTGHRHWETHVIPLSDFAANNDQIYLRFDIRSEGNRTADGVYFDDIRFIDLKEPDATSPIQKEVSDRNLVVYPNPGTNQVIIDLIETDKEFERIKVINNLGQIIEDRAAESSSHSLTIDMSDYLTGTYFIQVYIDGTIINKKIIKI